MAKGTLNKVILIGNLGADPEVRYMPNGGAVATLRIATTESWKDQQSGQQQERTEWHRVTMYRRLAEIAGEYLRKGSKVYVEGQLRTRKWQDQATGQDRYSTEIVANEMQMLDGKGGGGGGGRESDDYGAPYSPPQPRASGGASRPASAPPAQEPGYSGGGLDDFDDDIPF